MKTSELIKKLKRNGCYFVKHASSHDLWFSPTTGKNIVLPRHKNKEIPTGTANSIMKDAGIL